MLRSVGINVIVVDNVSTKFRVKDNAGSQLDLAAATTILPQSGALKTVPTG
jgi:hypothetical protein